MDIALCYESVLPARGGAETYIGDLARRLARDGHAVHLYACRWDAAALPAATHFHRLDVAERPAIPAAVAVRRGVRSGARATRSTTSASASTRRGARTSSTRKAGCTPRAPRTTRSSTPERLSRSVRGARQVVRPGRVVVRPARTQAVPRRKPPARGRQQPDGAAALRGVLRHAAGVGPRGAQRDRPRPVRGRRPAQAAA